MFARKILNRTLAHKRKQKKHIRKIDCLTACSHLLGLSHYPHPPNLNLHTSNCIQAAAGRSLAAATAGKGIVAGEKLPGIFVALWDREGAVKVPCAAATAVFWLDSWLRA